MSAIEITEVSIPETLDSPEAEEFLALVELRNAVNRHDSGSDDNVYTAAELLPGWQKTAFEPKRLFAARLDGRLVGRGIYETRTEEAPTPRGCTSRCFRMPGATASARPSPGTPSTPWRPT